MTKQHSPYGGSQVYRYAACPGSVALIAKAPPAKSSVYAEEGTFAHRLAEICLRAGVESAKDRIGSKVTLSLGDGDVSEKVVTKEMAEAVDVYLDAVWSEYAGDDAAEIEVEERFQLDIEAAEGEAFGTNDALVYQPSKAKLTIFDYKHGAGVLVGVENNHQLKFYAIGALQAHPEWVVREVELVVVQPRAFNAGEDGLRRWSMPMVDIIEYPYELNEAILATKQENAPLVPGDHCQFCPASIICHAREQKFVEAVNKNYQGVSLPKLAEESELSLDLEWEHMAKIVAAYEALGAWVNDLRTAMDDHLLAGGKVPGWKVVEKIARRKWVASDEAVSDWLELMYGVPQEESRPPSLVTITDAKKLLKDYAGRERYADAEKALTTQFTIKESAGLTTAPESDKRPAVEPVAAEFGSVQLGALESENA